MISLETADFVFRQFV